MTNWFWAHRRNTSLHHMSLFVRGLHSKGFLPTVDFWFDNQLYVGKKGKGVYIFYDQDQMSRKYKNIQESIDANKDFSRDFKKISDEIFARLFAVCKRIDAADLATAEETLAYMREFRQAITIGPIITVQLWGIEACWDESYCIAAELKDQETGVEFEQYKGELSQSTGKSVAFSERESFLLTLHEIQKSGATTVDDIMENPLLHEHVQRHIEEFFWVNSEYVSESLPFDAWATQFLKEVDCDASAELEKLRTQHKQAIAKREALIGRLGFSRRALHALDALNIFVSERDWAKGKFCYALASYDRILRAAARFLDQAKEDILLHDIDELEKALKERTPLDVQARRELFGIVSKRGTIDVLDAQGTERMIQDEGIGEMFEDVEMVDEFRGVIACAGKTEGIVRVIDDPRNISTFQAGEILVTYMTTMEFTPIFKKAKGVITDEGGLSSHAAIISREFGLPCIVGTKIATRTLKTGDHILLDAERGIVRRKN